MSANVGPTEVVRDPTMYASFDRLPRSIRRIVADAPFDYAVTPLLDELNNGVSIGGRQWAIEQFAIGLEVKFAQDVGDDAFENYGPEHPQSIAPREKKK